MNYWDKAARERKGVAAVLPAFPEWTFQVRRFSGWSPDFQRATARIAAQPDIADLLARRAASDYMLTEADQLLEEGMIRQAFAEGCLISWEDVTGPDGKPLPYSRENARLLLESIPELYKDLQAFATDPKNFAPMSAAAKEAIASGNLLPASSS